MMVGVNYPWFNYGWDFGDAPPNWRRGREPNWTAHIDQHLALFVRLGLRVVRWFILADGLIYGTGSEAPRPDADPARGNEWRFQPGTLNPAFLTHFRALLDAFQRINQGRDAPPLLIMPVFLDFNFCAPGSFPVGRGGSSPVDTGWVKGGRADAIVDPAKRGRFLEAVLRPLLRLAHNYRPYIYAWDVINEPEWVTNDWHPHSRGGHPVGRREMQEFITQSMRMIRGESFKVTVGFNRLETIRSSRIYADYNQFHYYPQAEQRLVRNPFNPQWPGIIGEFATSSAQDRWPDLTSARLSQRVLNRLRFAHRQGYPLALAWSAHPNGADRHTAWTAEVQQDIECFTQARNCPPASALAGT